VIPKECLPSAAVIALAVLGAPCPRTEPVSQYIGRGEGDVAIDQLEKRRAQASLGTWPKSVATCRRRSPSCFLALRKRDASFLLMIPIQHHAFHFRFTSQASAVAMLRLSLGLIA
jgi:hypothetical protein